MVQQKIDYNRFLWLFCSADDRSPSMKSPNTIGDKTYATDGRNLIIIPNNLLTTVYEPHPMAPNYQRVLDQVIRFEPIRFKYSELFKAMDFHPKAYDMVECEKCEGDGWCPHCGAHCEDCDGEGEVEDRSLPMVYSEKHTIEINGHCLTVARLERLQKILIESDVERFELIGQSGAASLFKAGAVEILAAHCPATDDERLPNVELKQTKDDNTGKI